MKTYTFWDDSWWDSNGCSCCPDTLMECYNSYDTDGRLGSAHSKEWCYVHSIITEIGWEIIPEDYEEKLWEMSVDELKVEAANLNITVEIE